MFKSTKTYGHDIGLSCCFRQWRATDSHCRFLHGYAIGVHLEFWSHGLDHRNWVVNFGGLKPVKAFLEETFDHKLIVAEDDPELFGFKALADAGLVQLTIMPHVGCEMFAKFIYDFVSPWIKNETKGRVNLDHVEVREHGANSAIYIGDR